MNLFRVIEFILAVVGFCTVARGWVWVCDHVLLPERKQVPGLPCDGRPLSAIEKQRFGWIEDGYGQTAREPGRQR